MTFWGVMEVLGDKVYPVGLWTTKEYAFRAAENLRKRTGSTYEVWRLEGGVEHDMGRM